MDVAGPANGQSFLFKPKNTLRFEDEGRQSRDWRGRGGGWVWVFGLSVEQKKR